MPKQLTRTTAERADWQKLAAAQTASTADTEKSFCDLAYQAIANNCGPLMKPEYRVGFEIVHKNDDSTRMAGIFVFRVNQDKYYAPVFFINGNVKGNILLYRVNQKTFVPATNDWCEYLVSLSSAPEGEGVPIADRRTMRNQMDLIQVVEPPVWRGSSMRKFAHVEEPVLNELLARRELDGNVLGDFIQQDGGFNAIGKIKRAAENNFDFAQALFLGSQPEQYMPDLAAPKSASAPAPLLTLHTGLMKNAHVKTVTEADLAKGYVIEDFRKEAQLNEHVYEAYSKEYTNLTNPGVYEALMADGSHHQVLCGYFEDLGCASGVDGINSYGANSIEYPSAYPSRNTNNFVVVDTTNKHSTKICNHNEMSATGLPVGKFISDISESDGVAKPTAGKAYRIFNAKHKSFSEPFHIKSVEEDNGLTKVICAHSPDGTEGKPIFLNPDYDDADKCDRVFGKHCVFVEVSFTNHTHYTSFDSDVAFGSQDALTMAIFDDGYKMATVKKSALGYVAHTNEIGRYSHELSPLAAKVFLMTKCAMKEPLADTIITRVDVDRAHSFFYRPMAKVATNLRFNQWPEFMQNVDNDYNVLQEPQTSHIMQTDRDEQYMEPVRVGDRYMGEGQAGQPTNADSAEEAMNDMDTKSPMELYQISQTRGNSALFDHGMVGALANTYDSMAMVAKWLPKMEEGLDCIGRTLFLFYWKPEDFSQAYGADDQSQLENKLNSNFKSLGALVLDMSQKAKQTQDGTPSLT